MRNAGINTEACFGDIGMAEIRRLFDAMNLFREALPLLGRTPDPMVVFMSSFADVAAGPATSAHSGA
jgi:hypothetical protein